MAEVIIVTGRRINWTFWGYGFDETGGYSMQPQLYPETGEGGAPWEDPSIYETHNALCQTPADAAKSISNTIMSTEATRGANNWTKYEYGALIVKSGDRYGAYNNLVQTDWQNGW